MTRLFIAVLCMLLGFMSMGSLQAQDMTLNVHQGTLDRILDSAPSWPLSAIDMDNSRSKTERSIVLLNGHGSFKSLVVASINQVEELLGTIKIEEMDEKHNLTEIEKLWNQKLHAYLGQRSSSGTEEIKQMKTLLRFRSKGKSSVEEIAKAHQNLHALIAKRDEKSGVFMATKALAAFVLSSPKDVNFNSKILKMAPGILMSDKVDATVSSFWMKVSIALDQRFAVVKSWVTGRTKHHIKIGDSHVDWLNASITKRPILAIAQPILARELNTRLAGRIEVNYEWHGLDSKHSGQFWLSFEGQELRPKTQFHLKVQDLTKVVAIPEVDKLNVTCETMGIDFRADLKPMINRQFERMPYVVLDLSSVKLPFGDSNLKREIKALSIKKSPNSIQLGLTLD
ncbi:MAG: hypothetical protein ACI97A_003849 [Planctomycetota bacterium]|jgi:hypothetical protein